MSDIEVNGNTYTGVESIKLMKADDSGYAEYKEGAGAAEDFRDVLNNGGYDIGDYESDAATPYIGWLGGLGGGTVSYPYATSTTGGFGQSSFENVLLPNVVSMNSRKSASGDYSAFSMVSAKVTGIVDLRNLTTIQNINQPFASVTIGTLKLGGIGGTNNNWMQKATITNFVWYGLTESILNSTYTKGGLNNATAITNLYVPADFVETVQGWITDGSLTKVTNVYRIDDWEE